MTEAIDAGWHNLDEVSFLQSPHAMSPLCDPHEWRRMLAAARRYAGEQQGDRVLLHHADALQFCAWFVALSTLGKHLMLAPNQRPDTLAELGGQVDWSCPPDFPEPGPEPLGTVRLSEHTRVSFFSSGSSGKAKRIDKVIRQLTLETEQLHRTFGTLLTSDTLVAATVPPNHIYGLLFRVLWPMYAGLPLLGDQVEYIEELQALAEQTSLMVISSPAHLSRFSDLAGLKRRAVGALHIFSSGGALPLDTAQAYSAALGQAPIEVFGSTETGGIAWRQGRHDSGNWQPFGGVEIALGENDCLRLRSPYVNSATWYQTQDRVRITARGHFELLGRADRIVKVADKRLSLPDMEERLRDCDLVRSVALVSLGGKRSTLGAVVVLSDEGWAFLRDSGKNALNQQLRRFLRRHYEGVLLPRRFRYVDALPYDERGKLSQLALEALFQ